MWAVPTTRGVVTAMQLNAGARWGAFVNYSLDGGNRFETMRELGKGQGQSPMSIKALIAVGSRVLLLFTADTPNDKNSDRSYYVMATTDGGETWTPP